MIIVEVYRKGYMEFVGPIAILSYSGRGNKITIKTEDKVVNDDLEVFTNTTLALRKQGIVAPTNRQEWMEALPEAIISVPYWFKITDNSNELQEEEINDIEEDTEDDIEEEGGEEDSSSDDEGNE